MSTVLVIAIPVLLVLAAVMVIATGRKRATSDPEGRVTGTLSVETRQRDGKNVTPVLVNLVITPLSMFWR